MIRCGKFCRGNIEKQRKHFHSNSRKRPVAAEQNIRAVRRLLKYLRISVDYFHRRKACNTLCWAHISTPVGLLRNPWMASVWSFAPTSCSTDMVPFGFRKIVCFSFHELMRPLKKHVDFNASLVGWPLGGWCKGHLSEHMQVETKLQHCQPELVVFF